MNAYPIYKLIDLQFDRIVEVDQIPVGFSDRPQVENKWRKLKYFLLREGFAKTFNKINSKTQKNLQIERFFTTLVLEAQNKKYYHYSTQFTQETTHFVIDNQFYEQPLSQEELEDKSIFNQFEKSSVLDSLISLNIIETTENPINYDSGVFIYGLGDYARVYIAPTIKKINKIYCVDYNSQFAEHFKNKFQFKQSSIVPQDSYPTLKNTQKPLAIIATYHSDHARIASEIFEQNPNTFIFIEKPPCVTLNDIKALNNLYKKGAKFEVGYNRRYIPENIWIKNRFYETQKVITISVKEILLNQSHWYFWKNQGTRITGNLTHWIDIAVYWIDGHPTHINVLSSPAKDETLAVAILFSDGSLVNITVSDKGNSLRGVQENIEIRTQQETYTIYDYTKFTHILSNGEMKVKNKLTRQKGHELMYQELLKNYAKEKNTIYERNDLIKTSLTTYFISKMFSEGITSLSVENQINEFLTQ